MCCNSGHKLNRETHSLVFITKVYSLRGDGLLFQKYLLFRSSIFTALDGLCVAFSCISTCSS